MTKQNKLIGFIKKIDFRLFIIAILITYYVLYWGNFQNFINDIDHCQLTFCDFVSFYYPAGKAILNHTQIPAGFYYSNFAAVLLTPFALFREKTATILWGVLQVILIGLFYFFANKQLTKDKISSYIFTFLFFTSAPLLNNIKWGQFSILITAGIWGAFILYKNDRRILSALLLGLMIAIKFYPAIFLLLFFFKRDWKYLFFCCAVAVVCLVLIPLPFMGFSPGLLPHLIPGEQVSQLFQSAVIRDNIDTQYLPSVIARYFNLPINSFIYTFMTIGSYLVVIFMIYLAYLVSKSSFPGSLFWVCGLLFITFPFWIPSAWPHYFVYLPCLQIMAFQEISRQKNDMRRLSLILWIFSIVLSSILTMQAVHNWYKYIGLGSLLWSNLTILLLFFIILWGYSKNKDSISNVESIN
jgi:alpha-1,2-mannosyltransferase